MKGICKAKLLYCANTHWYCWI